MDFNIPDFPFTPRSILLLNLVATNFTRDAVIPIAVLRDPLCPVKFLIPARIAPGTPSETS